jgi:regulator of RNase E activity RraB
MKLKHIPATIDINSRNEQRIAGIVNINDKKTRYLDVTIIASGEKLDISGCTVTAIFVIDDVLVNNAVDCTVTNNIVTIPLENFNGRYGYLSIELNIVKDGTVIVNTPIPLRIQVTSSIADSAKISEKTYGTIAETVKEVYDARGTYENLSNRLTGIDNEITDLDETVTMKINLKADKADTLAGYGITDAYDKTYMNKALSNKLIKMPFDTTPSQNSPNYITSGTLYSSVNTLNQTIAKNKTAAESAIAAKYDSSNIERGTGELSPATPNYEGCAGRFDYVKNGKVVTVSVNITKLIADKAYIQMSGLPFPAKIESKLSALAVYSTTNKLRNIRLDGSWLYISSPTDKFTDDEKINFTITYIRQ